MTFGTEKLEWCGTVATR